LSTYALSSYLTLETPPETAQTPFVLGIAHIQHALTFYNAEDVVRNNPPGRDRSTSFSPSRCWITSVNQLVLLIGSQLSVCRISLLKKGCFCSTITNTASLARHPGASPRPSTGRRKRGCA
jgi:hypothetical protein